jgi:[ribosomal protein S5]-alanine N-acetyltransferase
LVLRIPGKNDVPEVLDYYVRNEKRFAPTDPPKPEGFLTERYWLEFVDKARAEFVEDRSVRLFAFDAADDRRVIGTASFTQIARGPFQACYLGYGIDGACEGKGLMREALELGIQYMFEERGLHRIMANHLVDNERSAALLKRLGFEREGVARAYLFINGAWRDHALTARVNSGWRPPVGL